MGLLDNIIAAESGGDANARNPRSSAGGLGQFIDSTWLNMMAKYRPDITGSRSDLLALKSDPNLSKEMVANYAAENENTLKSAGLEASPGNIYLAHFAGPHGAVKVLQSSPDAPVSAILGEAVARANPFLNGMSAADLKAWADKKVGGSGEAQSRPPTRLFVSKQAPAATPTQPMANPNAAIPFAPPMGQLQVQQSQSQQQPDIGALLAEIAAQNNPAMKPPDILKNRDGPDRLAKLSRIAQLKAAFPMRPFFFGARA